jgi:predicted lysophospholipase L1 biosynthesis ABC-type transport system permease subunit
MTKLAKFRNAIHYFLGAVFAYYGLSATIIEMNEIQTFLIKSLVGSAIGLLVGVGIELYQNWFLKQFVDWNDIKRTGLGGLAGGIICLAFPNVHFITTYMFYFALLICVAEIVRSQIALRK